MKLSSLCPLVLPLLGLSCSAPAWGVDTLGAGLALSPNLCLTDQDNAQCNIRVTLKWTTTYPVCIEVELPRLQRWCIKDKTQNSLTLQISSDKNVRFVMRDQRENKPLAEAILKVKSLSTPQTRRRFRNPWSIF